MIIVVMGVAGSGKTTIGKLLAEKFSWPFFEGDDFHPKANVDKMTQGIPLTDEDRAGWLASIAAQIAQLEKDGRSGVVACSALKDAYRKTLSQAGKDVRFVYLKGDYQSIRQRLESRVGHFMKPAMLESQFEILEEPGDSLVVEIDRSPAEIVETVIKALRTG